MGWYEDNYRRTFNPYVAHAGGGTCSFYELYRFGMKDQPVAAFRCAPMDAIAVALRRRGDDEPARRVWHVWLSIVLGLPFRDPDDFASTMAVEGCVADILVAEMSTEEEIRAAERNR